MSDSLPITTANVLKPGDKVLLGVGEVRNAEQARRMLDALEAEFPGVTFVAVDASVVVAPGESRDAE